MYFPSPFRYEMQNTEKGNYLKRESDRNTNGKQFKCRILNLHLISSSISVMCCIIIYNRDRLILHVTWDSLWQMLPLKFNSLSLTQQGFHNCTNSWAYCTKQQLNVLSLHFIMLLNYMVYFNVCKIWHKGIRQQSNTKLYHSNPLIMSIVRTQTYHKHKSKTRWYQKHRVK